MFDEDEYVGLPEDEACVAVMNKMMTARIVQRDDKHFIVTRDLRLDRVNFRVRDGRVTEASIG